MSNSYLFQKQMYEEMIEVNAELDRTVEQIKNYSSTTRKYLSEFPSVEKYIATKFAGIDVSDVEIYRTSTKGFKAIGMLDAAGCYIKRCNTILYREYDPSFFKSSRKHKFYRELYDLIGDVGWLVDEVLVHELIHAISVSKVRRASSKIRKMEEEFAHTNTIDYMREKGMTDEQIINSSLFIFCMSDMLEDPEEVHAVLSAVDKSDRYNPKVLDKHADVLAPLFFNRAKERAKDLLQRYDKFGFLSNRLSPNASSGGQSKSFVDLTDEGW